MIKRSCAVLLFGMLWVGIAYAGETATGVATLGRGRLVSITVTFGGSGYLLPPVITLTGGGGSGAAAQAVLEGDSVGSVVVLSPGDGYTSAPEVTFESPPVPLSLGFVAVDGDPRLKVEGPRLSRLVVERSESADGPWESWTEVVVPAEGAAVVDQPLGPSTSFYRAVTDTTRPTPILDMVWIEPGTFMMGSPASEVGRSADETLHEVTLSQGFYLGRYELTQGSYLEVVGTNPSSPANSTLPVNLLKWSDATNYCHLLTLREQEAGRLPANWKYVLPTEAQWEYACRAGTSTRFGYGDDTSQYIELQNYAWYDSSQMQPVGQKLPNPWGLYDMHGNVSELCADWYGNYPASSVTDPQGPATGVQHVARGGSWVNAFSPQNCRSAARRRSNGTSNADGFRPALISIR